MELNRDIRTQNGLGIIAITIVILGIIFCSGRGFVPDESYYQINVDLLRQYGFSDAFLINLYGPAGPTYAVLHYILSPLTHGNVVDVRLVNIFLLVFSIFLLNKILLKAVLPNLGLSMTAIPMTLVCGGLGLTEMPALFFLLCAIYFMQQFIAEKRILVLILAGLFYSFSILGRQPYLLVFPVFIFYLFYPFRKRDIHLILIFTFISLALPIYCFMVWKGLIPATGNVAEAGGLVYHHFFLACGYCMLAFLFAIPGFIVHPRKLGYSKLIGLLAVSIVISIIFKLEYAIMNSIAIKLLPAKWFSYYTNVGFGLLIFLSIYFIGNCMYRFFESEKDKFTVLAYLSMFALLISTITIKHQFSSRYVFQLTPFIFMAGAKFNLKGLGSNVMRAVGVVAGLFALYSYYNN